jgi:hypothetical protein
MNTNTYAHVNCLTLASLKDDEREEFLKWMEEVSAMRELRITEWWIRYREADDDKAKFASRLKLLLWLWLLLMKDEDRPETCQYFYTKSRWPASERGVNTDVLDPIRLAVGKKHFGEQAATEAVMAHDQIGNPCKSMDDLKYKKWFFDPQRLDRQIAFNPTTSRFEYSPNLKKIELYDPSQSVDWERTKEDSDDGREYWQSVQRQAGPDSESTKPDGTGIKI